MEIKKSNQKLIDNKQNLSITSLPHFQKEKPHIYYRGECPNCDSWSASAGKENHPLHRTPMYCDRCDAFRGWVTVK